MSEDLFAEKLDWFKQHEKPETVLLIAGNPDIVKFVLAWTTLDVRHSEKPTELSGSSENEVWEWLWENVSYSREALIKRLGVPFSESGLERNMKLLIANRVLYPDGTVNTFVQRYLREQVIRLFEAKPKKAAKRSG